MRNRYRFIDFILGFLAADILASLYLYLRREVVELNGLSITPDFFALIIFVDIIVLAFLVKVTYGTKGK